MKRTIAFALFLTTITCVSIAQSSIKTVKNFQHVSGFDFSDEYQYLSTDFYLFNEKRFGKLINDLHHKSKRRFIRKIQEEKIEYLMITANIKDLKYFGGDLSYPIYSFQTDMDKEGGYKVHVLDNDKVIHLIDNLPLSPGIANIDASIEGNIITDRTKDKVIRSVADQLISLSEIPNPSGAALAVIRELGKFMKTSTSKNMYKFNSTIRLYESQDFNKQFYSLDLYVFLPSNKKGAYIDTQKLEDYLAQSDNPEINREQLEELIGYKGYPYFAVVNYKSKYSSEDISGDEITVASIQKRRQRINQKFEKGNIPNKNTYHHEIKFLEFLEKFAELKSQVNTYRLNKKNELTSDYSRTMLLIAEQYIDLQKSYRACETEYKNDATYKSSFRDKYQNILDKAGLYLEMDNPLKSTKEMVAALLCLDTTEVEQFSVNQREKLIRELRGVDLPKDEENRVLIKTLTARISTLEAIQYTEVFEDQVIELNHSSIDQQSMNLRDRLAQAAKNSYCLYCKQNVMEALEAFDLRVKNEKLKIAREHNKQILQEARDVVYKALKQEYCFKLWYQSNFSDTIVPPHITLLFDQFSQLQGKRRTLEGFITMDFYSLELETLEEYNQNLKDLCQTIDNGYKSLCIKQPDACACE